MDTTRGFAGGTLPLSVARVYQGGYGLLPPLVNVSLGYERGVDMSLKKNELYQFMRNDLGVDTSDLDDQTLFFSTGVVDSFSLISLITFIQNRCEITVDAEDVTLENLDSVERIMAFVDRMRHPANE